MKEPHKETNLKSQYRQTRCASNSLQTPGRREHSGPIYFVNVGDKHRRIANKIHKGHHKKTKREISIGRTKSARLLLDTPKAESRNCILMTTNTIKIPNYHYERNRKKTKPKPPRGRIKIHHTVTVNAKEEGIQWNMLWT
jgi:hypothetical protein